MFNRRLSVRTRLLASVMVGFFPATAMAANTFLGPSDSRNTQLQMSGSDRFTSFAGSLVTTGQSAIVINGDTTADFFIANGGSIGVIGNGSGIGMAGNRSGPIYISNSAAGTIRPTLGAGIALGGALGPVTIDNAGLIGGGVGNVIVTGSGDDVLNLATGSDIVGVVNLGAGYDTINLNGVGTAYNPAQTLGKTLGGERLNVNAGSWRLAGEVNADLVSIAGGAVLNIDDIAAQSAGGAFVTPTSGVLTISNNGSLILNTADARTDAYADNLHLSGTGNLYLGGGGTVQYGQNVTMTGNTTIGSGTLVVTGNNIASPIFVGEQSRLLIGAAYSAPDADGYVTIVNGGGATGSLTGNIVNNGAVLFDRSTASTYAGAMSGSGTLSKTGAGSLTLSGSNTLSGPVSITGGAVTLTGTNVFSGGVTVTGAQLTVGSGTTGSLQGNIVNNTSLVFNRSDASTYSGSISGTGQVSKRGAGTLTLSGVSTGTGQTTVEAGKLMVSGSITSPVFVTSDASFEVSSTGSARLVTGSGATVTNAGTISTPGVTTGTQATISFSALNNTLTNSGVIRSYNDHAVSFGAGNDTLNLSTGTIIYGRVDMGGGVDTVNLAGSETFKSNNQVIAPIYGSEITNVNSGYWTHNTTLETDRINIASGATLDIDSTDLPPRGGAAISAKNGVLTIVNNGALIKTSGALLDLHADDLHLSGSGTVELKGGGVLQYGQNVTLTGRTTVANGTLVVTGDNIASPFTVGAQGVLRIGAAFSQPDADGYVTIGSGGGLSGSITGDIVNSGQIIFDRADNITYSGNISGNGFRVAKRGAGVLTLTGVNANPFQVDQGGLVVTGTLAPLSTNVVNDGGSLTITSTGATGRLGGNGATITNAGTVEYLALNYGGAVIELGRASTVNNSGVIRSGRDSAIHFRDEADTLNLFTGSQITGKVEMGGGVDTINLAGSLNTKTPSQSLGNIFGSEALNVNSGYWTLAGEVEANTVTVAGGATFEIDDVNSQPGGAFLSSGGAALTIANAGAIILNTADTRTDIYADSLHLSGSGTMQLTGGGTMQYGQNIALTGATTVTNGTLVVTGDNLVTPITVGSQGALRIGAAFSAPDADGYVNIVAGGGTTGSLTGNVVNNGAVLFDRSNASTYAGAMSGTGTVAKSGAGVLTLSGANTYTGATTVTGGGLVVSAPFASSGVSVASGTGLTFTGSNAMTYAGAVTGAGSLTKTGAGVLALSGASTHSGGTTVSAGGLTLSGSLVGLTTLAAGTNLNITSTGSARVINANGATVTNAGTIDTPLVNTGTLASVTFGNTASTLANSGVIRSYNGNAVRFGTGADILNLATGSSIVGRVDMGAGADTVNLAGTSATKATGQSLANIFGSEALNVNSGYWTLAGEVEANTVSVAAGATFEIDDVNSQPGGAFLSSGGAALTIANAGAIILNTADTRTDVYADSLHLSGSGTMQLTGGGALQYGQNIALTGATTVTNGTLVVTGDNIASALNIGTQGVVRVGAAFSAPDVDGYVSLVAGGGTTGSLSGNVLNNGAVIFDRSNASTYAGVMSGTGTVTKSGAGVLTLSGANTYTGATTVSGGGLVVSAPFASSSVSLAGGSGLTFTGPNALTYAGVVSGAGDVTKTGAGVTTLSGANTYTGVTTISAGGLAVTGSIASQSVTVASGANLTFGSAANQTYAGVVSGVGSLTKSGAGALTLTGANTYTGPTTVSGGSLILATTLGSNVTVAQGGTLQIGTGGTTGSLTGNLVDNGTVIFNRSDNYLLVGDFSGTGSLIKRGAGLLTLDGLYTFSGTTTIEAGTIKISKLDAGGNLVVGAGANVDLSGSSQTVGGLAGGTGSTVTINNASLTINQQPSNTPTVFGGALTGTGSLTLTGGGVTDLAGTNTYTGPTTVNGGTLKVNGSITSPVTVNSGGTLGGSGTINGAVTIGSGGALSPGNSPGVTSIAGPLTLASGSSLIVEVDPTATVKNDRVNVTAGAATIVAGAKLDVRPLGAIGNYGRVNDYVILTATGGVNGTFGANVTSTMALLTPSLSYSTDQVSLRLIRNDISFASLAQTANQTAVAGAAEGTGPSGAAYGALVGQDAAGARTGYDALSGEAYGAANSLVIDESRHQRAALLGQAASRGTGAWARAHDGEATIDATTGSAEARDRSFGVSGGGQMESGDWTLGFGLAYGKSNIDVAARAAASDVQTLRAGVYAGGEFGAWRVRLGADAARHDFDASRAIVFPTVSQNVTAQYKGSSQQLFGELAYAIEALGGSFEPFAEFAGVRATTDGFAETGGTLGLNVAEENRNLTFATIGARYTGAWNVGSGSVRPQVSVALRRAGGDIEGTSTAAFATSSFTVAGAGIARDTALIDAGVGFDLSRSISGSVSYSGALSSDAKDHAVRAGLSVRF